MLRVDAAENLDCRSAVRMAAGDVGQQGRLPGGVQVAKSRFELVHTETLYRRARFGTPVGRDAGDRLVCNVADDGDGDERDEDAGDPKPAFVRSFGGDLLEADGEDDHGARARCQAEERPEGVGDRVYARRRQDEVGERERRDGEAHQQDDQEGFGEAAMHEPVVYGLPLWFFRDDADCAVAGGPDADRVAEEGATEHAGVSGGQADGDAEGPAAERGLDVCGKDGQAAQRAKPRM